ncbi:MAG: GNAT family N-acetyltransferase [Emcibacter sp.]|nr:GNAT family N-acetyltransferase [Emcibacter sp.]
MNKMEWTLYPISALADFQNQWQSLNKSIGNSPLLDIKFVIPLIDNFADGSEKLALFGSPEAPEVMTIINPGKKGIWASFQSSNAPLGLWLSKNPSLDISAIKALIKKLPGTAMALALTQQDPLFLTRPQTGNSVSTLDYITTAHIDFPDSFEDYWATRSKNLRHNMKRQRNFLTKNAIETRLETCVDGDQMEQAVQDYGKIESSGWKGQIDSAVTAGDKQSQFYSDMLTAFSTSGEGLVLRYFYNEDLIATDLCLIRDKVLYILKTTYDETIKGTSPAHIMRFEYYQTAIASGLLQRVEFYGPLKDWHTKWTNDARIIFHTNIYRNSCIAWAHKIIKSVG